MARINRLGLLAPEFPPQIGGMSQLAHGLARGLADLIEVTVYTSSDHGLSDPPFAQVPRLTSYPARDTVWMNDEPVDAWLLLNAGLTPLARSLEKPVFCYMHGNDFLDPWIPCGPAWFESIRRPYAAVIRQALRRRALRRSVDHVDKIICNSRQTAQLIESELRVELGDIAVVPPGVENEFFDLDPAKRRDSTHLLTVATLNHFVRRKNIDGVLKAIRLLQSKIDIQYTVVGGGDDLERLRTLACDLGVGQQTHFKGSVDRPELLRSFAEADLFVLASKATAHDVEGFGIVYLEAAAAGVPSICSAEGGATDAVIDGLSGILIQDSSPEAIAGGIERFNRERDAFNTARTRSFAEEFRWHVVAPKLLAHLNDAPSSRVSAAPVSFNRNAVGHLGILAAEFPPQIGGMPQLAYGLTSALAALTQVTLYTSPGNGVPATNFDQKPVLSLIPGVDQELLRQEPVDTWLSLNAGFIPLAGSIGRPLFTYMHGNDFLKPWIPCGPAWFENIRRPYAAVIRQSLRKRALESSIGAVCRLFCISRRTAQLVDSQFRVRPGQLAVMPPGVDDDFFSVNPSRSSSALHVLTVASLNQFVRRKNIDGVLKAISLLKPRLDIEYTVVGGGDDLPRLQRLAQELGLDQQTHFKGSIDRCELLTCYSKADLFILASRASKQDVEGFGIVYLEASAAGVPSICSVEGGATDAVVDGHNGIIIEKSSPDCIAAGIERFVRERDRFDPAKTRTFAEDYRWKVLAPALLRHIGDALAGEPSTSTDFLRSGRI